MKQMIRNVKLAACQMDYHHIQLALVTVNLIPFVLGAAAPEDGSGGGG